MISLFLLGLCGVEPAPLAHSADFRLQDYRGVWRSLEDFKDKTAVVIAFTGVECPLAKQYSTRLVQLAKKYKEKNVGFVAVDANEQDSITALADFARAHSIDFPLVKDVGNVLADQLQASRTPEVFVLDQSRAVRYRGKIDERYGVGYVRPNAGKEYLVEALDAVLAGKPVAQPKTEPAGCYIGRIRTPDARAEVTFSNQIVRLFQKRCVDCHHDGSVAPFSLTSYREAAGWATTIREVVDDGRMPPWYADPHHGKFINDARLSPEDKSLIRRWVDAGAPEGDPKQAPSSAPPIVGWRIPKPDLVLKIPKPYNVKAEGAVSYQYFEVDPGFKEDKWIQAAEAVPDNRAVVHHILILVKPPRGQGQTRTPGLEADWLVATAPGAMPLQLPPGRAKFIPKGATLIFQMHYTPNGTPQTDQSCVGLVFADPKTIKQEVVTTKAATNKFVLKPRTDDQKVEADRQFSEDVLLLAMFPHMHLRGKSFRYEAVYPDGKREILLDVPHYDFAWQNAYIFAEPKRLPAGSTMHCVAYFDNSEANKSNPNPNSTVRWGDQTWEEMMIGYFDMVLADQDLTVPRSSRFEANLKAGKVKLSPALIATAAKSATDPAAIDDLQAELQRILPQLDRIDVMTLDGTTMRITAATRHGMNRRLAAIRQFPVVNTDWRLGVLGAKSDLAQIAKAGRLTVSPDLRETQGWDLKFLALAFRSGVHVPLSSDKPTLVNFWSRDAKAFPPQAVEFLERLVKEASSGKK